MNDHIYKSKNITMCPDGKYRWVYELDMYKSSAIIKEVWRVFLISVMIVAAFVFVMNIRDNGLMEALQFVVQTAAILLGIFLVLSIIGYLVFAFMIGGKYCVVFEMDEEGINHKQHQKHVKKAELIGAITALAGMAGGNLSTVGTGVLAAARTSMLTYFDDVKELEILPKEHLIRVNETLSRNQVYAEDEDFAFVASYIQARCRNAKVKGESFANVGQQQFGAAGARDTAGFSATGHVRNNASDNRMEDTPNATTPNFCSNCGAPVKPGSEFCANCGAKLQ
jgi:hypothetical protein